MRVQDNFHFASLSPSQQALGTPVQEQAPVVVSATVHTSNKARPCPRERAVYQSVTGGENWQAGWETGWKMRQ